MQPKSIILFFYGYILFFRRQHFDKAIAHIEDDYLGSHWLGSFALLAMDVDIL
ncbi:DUF2891 family protein [Campylobacter jejuni]|uniref:DUF2891 family protein n=1 Tax=Campylobacter jejuni TaxID=197 RepID=UPI000D30F549|nr:DUF2891 family protein [Campylobacter jejuni]EAJ6157243.1 DUF2891 family protein [Campylobacter jejuni]EIE6731398.1 DUF2891 family protein [Campylobacter jejuni]KAG5260296.1 DUF2891 family protein [Campylobacter jejuni]MDT9647253.1 DUF2891 domain-containing protein [Campylobacter jejuni]MDT9671450.1 DUF2891 domain-containing protein [Campylobacter jejuni]